uniref:Uncharacterized protein n=1 Tax=Candidatus Kentrum sp. TC TaxID=2126339 RepID=A0A450Z4Q5_9GAMM|nr:MAG: hypothetical protein BECKTC1821E_GA0114239_11239 [Candidatus Kentron sp. TC]
MKLFDALPMSREIACQFLAAIRAYCMESMAERGEIVHKFVIASSIDLVTLTQEVNPGLSPFNVAIPVYLEDFSDSEIRKFIQRLAPNKFTGQEIKKICPVFRDRFELLGIIYLTPKLVKCSIYT